MLESQFWWFWLCMGILEAPWSTHGSLYCSWESWVVLGGHLMISGGTQGVLGESTRVPWVLGSFGMPGGPWRLFPGPWEGLRGPSQFFGGSWALVKIFYFLFNR